MRDLLVLNNRARRAIEEGSYIPLLERRLMTTADRPVPRGWNSNALSTSQVPRFSCSYDAVTRRLLLVEYLHGRW